MKDFLKEYWLWIAIPFLLVIACLVVFMILGGSEDSGSPFQYNVF